MNIAIVEDDSLTALFIKETLEDFGHNIVGCYNEAQALLSIVKEIPIDLVFMDINISGSMDGIRCASKLQKNYKIPSVFLTSSQDNDTINDAMETSPLGYLIKPVDEIELQTALTLASKRLNIITDDSTVLYVGDYKYNKKYRTLMYNEEVIYLTEDEQKAISILFKSAGTTVSTQNIINYIWADEYSNNHCIKKLIDQLRKKLFNINIMYSPSIGYSV